MAINSNEPLSKTNDLELESADTAVSAGETLNQDPITGEPGAHPAAVGVGALSAGAAGAAIGMFAGPVGAVIGAAIGAVAGGFAGHEVAASNSEATTPSTTDLNPENTGSTTDDTGRPSSVVPQPEDALMVFPGSEFGSPAVTTEPVDPAAETATEGVTFADVPRDDEDEESVGHKVVGTSFGSGVVSASEENPATVDVPKDTRTEADELSDGVTGSGFTVGADPTETVRMAAYHRYLDRLDAGRPGDELGDWYDAEREVTRF